MLQNIRNFFISFIIGLVFFALIAWLIAERVMPEVSDDKQAVSLEKNETPKNEETDVKIKNDCFTALVACFDDYTERADAIAVINVNKSEKTFMICSLPTYMQINIGNFSNKSMAYLGDLINYKDNDFFIKKVESLIGLEIDYYAFMSIADFSNIIDEINGVTYDVPIDMYYKDVNGDVLVNLKKGMQKLDGNKAQQLLRYRGYNADDADETRRNIQCEFVLNVFESFIKEENRDKIDGIVKQLLGYIRDGQTNFTLTAFIMHKDTILEYEKYDKTIVNYPGITTTEKSKSDEQIDVFEPYIDEAIEDIFYKYRVRVE